MKKYFIPIIILINMSNMILCPPSRSRKISSQIAVAPNDSDVFSAQEIDDFSKRFQLSEQEKQQICETQIIAREQKEEQAELDAKLKKSIDEGWDTSTSNNTYENPATSKPYVAPSLLQKITNIPSNWWQENIANKNRLEHLMRFMGSIKTYTILLQKNKSEKLSAFIEELNAHNPGEGHRWLDEALMQAIEDRQEHTTRIIMKAAIPYKTALSNITRKKVAQFLITCSERKRKAQTAENEDFATDMQDLAVIIQEASQDNPEIEWVDIKNIEQYASDHTHALTKQATAGYLPRTISDRI